MQTYEPDQNRQAGATEELLRTVIDALPERIYVRDRQGRLLIRNAAHSQSAGGTPAGDPAERTDLEGAPPETAGSAHADEQALMQSGQVFDQEERCVDNTTGAIRWLQTTKIPLRGADGNVIGLVGVSRDLTGQKQLEEELGRASGQLQAMLDHVPDRIYFKDTGSRFVKCNRAVARRLGVRHPDLVVGKMDSDFYPADKAREFYEDEQHIIRTGQALINKIERVDRRDGEVVWSSVTKVPLYDIEGRIVGLVGITRDITEQKQAEEALRISRDQLELRVAERTAQLSERNTELVRVNQDLIQTKALLEAMMENVPDRIFFKDIQSRFIKCSRALAQRLGVDEPALIVGKTDFDFHPRERAEEFYQDEQRIMRTGEVLANKVEQQTGPHGEILWASVTKVPLRDKSGKIIGLAGISRDITKQKEAEDTLLRAHEELEQRVAERTRELSERNTELARANEARAQAQRLLQALLDNIPDTIYFKDAQSRFLKVSKTLAQRLGVEADQAVGKTDLDFFSPEAAREFLEDEQRVLRTGESIINKVEKKNQNDGAVHWTSTTKVPMRDEHGAIIGLVGVNRDISDRIAAEEALRRAHDDLEKRVAERTAELTSSNAAMQQQILERQRAEQALAHERLLLRTLIDHIPDGVYAKDAACRKILANPADLRNLGCKNEADAIGKTDFDVYPREVAEKFYADDQRVIQGEPVLNREEYFLDESGKKHWLLTSKLPLRNQAGRVIGLVGIGRDITAVKEAEGKLESLHKQLVVASRQAGMAEVATGVLHNVGNVLNSVNVSGELIKEHLRTSHITSVAKLAQLIQDHQGDLATYLTQDERGRCVPRFLGELAGCLEAERAELQEEARKLMVNVEHIKEIVSAQQNYAGLSGVVENIMLPELVEDALKIHTGAFARHGVTVLKEFEPLPPVSSDKHKVLQILVNLLHNAKYACDTNASPRKEVTVRLKTAGPDRVRIEVADTGIGIPAENLTRVFSHGFTTRKNGHGFGLHSGALSAKEMGGSLTVHSDGIGKGATFILELPANVKTNGNGPNGEI